MKRTLLSFAGSLWLTIALALAATNDVAPAAHPGPHHAAPATAYTSKVVLCYDGRCRSFRGSDPPGWRSSTATQ